jgi:hypothetical protein
MSILKRCASDGFEALRHSRETSQRALVRRMDPFSTTNIGVSTEKPQFACLSARSPQHFRRRYNNSKVRHGLELLPVNDDSMIFS